MVVRPELERGAAPRVGKLDFPECARDGLPAKRGAERSGLRGWRGQFDGRADEIVAVATAVFLGFPLPVKGVEFGAGGEGLAGEILGLGLLLDEQDEESGTADRRVVVEVVHLRGAVVELQGKVTAIEPSGMVT